MFTTMDEYIAGFPQDVQAILEKIRATISKAAPGAEETINYGIPTFALKGNLVHFAAYKKHIGFYPTPSGIEKFKDELSVYEGAKGSVQFPLDKPMPLGLIRKIVKFRVAENVKRDLEKTPKKKAPYLASDTTIRFTVDKPMPAALVKKLVKARIAENEAQEQAKRAKA